MPTTTGKSVTNGQLANEDTFNGAYLSRKVDSDTIGIVCLNAPAGPSGPQVADAQLQINDNKTLSESNESRLDNLILNDVTDVDLTTNPPLIGEGIQWDGTNWVPVPLESAADENIAILGDGSVTWDTGTNNLTLSNDIHLSYTSFNKTSNTIQAQAINIVNNGEVAYVDINKINDLVTNLTVTVVAIGSFVAQDGRVIFARRESDVIHFGIDDLVRIENGQSYMFSIGGGGANSINDLTDVDTTTVAPVEGDKLEWDGTEWVPEIERTIRYTSSSGQSIADMTSTVIDFSTLDWDNLTQVTTGAGWRFTPDIPGEYFVNVRMSFDNSVNWAVNTSGFLQVDRYDSGNVLQESILLDEFVAIVAYNALFVPMKGATTLKMSSGDYLQVMVQHARGANTPLRADNAANYIEIQRVGR